MKIAGLTRTSFQNIRQSFRDISIHRKLTFIYIAAFIIPVTAITFYSISGMIDIFNEKNYVQNRAQCNQLSANLENRLDDFYKSLLSFSSSPITSSYFEYTYPDSSSFFAVYPDVNSHITSFLVSNPQVSDLRIYTDNPTFLKNSSTVFPVTDEIREQFAAIKNPYGSGAVITSSQKQEGGYSLSLCHQISFSQPAKYHTYLVLTYPEDILYSLYQHESDKLSLYLVSPAGEIISSSDRGLPGGKEEGQADILRIKSGGLPPAQLTQADKSYYYYSRFSDNSVLSGWALYLRISNETYLSDVFSLILTTLLLIVCLSFIGLLLFFLCSASISRRLNHLVTAMSGVKNDETMEIALDTADKDEIGILSRNFKTMMERIKKLIIDVYTSDLQVKDLEIKNKQAQLLALQSQINPHFLFNTMQSLSISCYNNDDYETAEYINKFCIFLRGCLYWETKNVPLSDEIRMVENYLCLQKLRYSDMFDFTIDIPGELSEIPIPRFTLQPIVENAIEHGLEGGNKQKGFLKIYAVRTGSAIHISVTDNGCGISREKLKELNEQLRNGNNTNSSGSGESIGIFNTNERLKLFFGSGFGIHLESTEGKGTEVMISITEQLCSREPDGKTDKNG